MAYPLIMIDSWIHSNIYSTMIMDAMVFGLGIHVHALTCNISALVLDPVHFQCSHQIPIIANSIISICAMF